MLVQSHGRFQQPQQRQEPQWVQVGTFRLVVESYYTFEQSQNVRIILCCRFSIPEFSSNMTYSEINLRTHFFICNVLSTVLLVVIFDSVFRIWHCLGILSLCNYISHCCYSSCFSPSMQKEKVKINRQLLQFIYCFYSKNLQFSQNHQILDACLTLIITNSNKNVHK